MKLRIDHQSIRLRLSKTDLEILPAKGFVAETLHLPQGSLTFKLLITNNLNVFSVFFFNETITVEIPAHQANNWMQTDEIGLYETLPLTHIGLSLKLLIEKDFPCKHNPLD
jgi:hypothetical protein